MSIAATALANTAYLPVTPAAVVRLVTPAFDQRRKDQPLAAPAQDSGILSADALRQARADALAELEDAGDAADTNTTRYLALDRDQLASMVFDRKQAYSLGERRSAQRQLELNDRVFLDRADELSSISGDDRVALQARLDLERSKSAIERATPKFDAVDVKSLQQQLADKTAASGGDPVSITLHYPNGWAASGKALPLPEDSAASRVSAGATRVALQYRESLY